MLSKPPSLSLSLLVFALTQAAPSDLTQKTGEVDSSTVREALKKDIDKATTQFRTRVSERITEMQAKGDAVKADALKRFDEDLNAFQVKVREMQPRSETGKMILERTKSRLEQMKTRFEEEFKKVK